MAITRTAVMSKPPTTPPPPPPPPSAPLPQHQQQQQEAVAETESNSNNNSEQQQAPAVSDYEQTREQRIKENRERLQKLGIVDLSHQLASIVASKRTPKRNFDRKSPLKPPSIPSSHTPRRSSRLQNAPPVIYTEQKEDKSRRPKDVVLEEGAKPEVYTEEHEKLLGNSEMPWTFGVDGYGADGNRIYDPVNGKTCHQCRQKTLGLRTHCCKCNLVQGQFCGDCLMARYGEHVVEANQNPNWICPPCRGICNCSLCRQAKGWYPTGAIYRTISNLGYKSVAHYLIATKRAHPVSETSSDDIQPAKRSLPFDGTEVPNDDGLDSKEVVESADISQQSEKKAGRPRENTEKEDSDGSKDSVKVTDKSDTKKASVGRPRKKPKTETNGAEDVRSQKDDSDGSKDSVKVTEKSDSKNARVGRPRKKPETETNGAEDVPSKKDDSDGTKDSVTDKSDSKKARVGRPRKKPETETNGAEDVPSKKDDSDGTKDSVTDKSDSKKARVGRPRKKLEIETNGAEDVPPSLNDLNTSTLSDSKSNVTQVRRSTRQSKKDNDDIVEKSAETSAATGDEAASTIDGLNNLDPEEDNVARKLRSRNET